MNSIIRPMTPKDKNSVLEMMRVFYASPAVFTNGSDDIFRTDIENCINDNPYLEGYIFEVSGEIQGYGMIAKAFHRIWQAMHVDRGHLYQGILPWGRHRKQIYRLYRGKIPGRHPAAGGGRRK